MFGVQAAAPVCQPGRPHVPFTVTKTRIRPGQPGLLWWSRKGELRDRRLGRNDLLVHIASRTVARVVEQVKPGLVRIQPWWPPESKETMDAFVRTKGKGQWVCWGQCWDDIRSTPKCMIPSKMTDDWDFFSKEVHRYPEKALSMMDRHPQALRSRWKGMNGKQRKAARRRFRGIMGKLNTVQRLDPAALDEYADKHAYAGGRTKAGVEFRKFILKSEEE